MDDNRPKIYAFDFDGTLTRRDSLIEIMRYKLGTKAFVLTMLRFMPMLLAMKAGLYANDKAKQRLFAHCFGGMTEDDFNTFCQRFARDRRGIMRPLGMEEVRLATQDGSIVAIVSASIDNWVAPFFEGIKGLMVIGTRPEVRDGRLTGLFATPNCYGIEKVRRLLEVFPDRKNYRLLAFGDSRGDFDLLDFSDEGRYKPFRKDKKVKE